MRKELSIYQPWVEKIKPFIGTAFNWGIIALGSIFLALMSQFTIPLPFSPVPVTLQTFAIALLAIGLGSARAPLAVIVFLGQATIGLPVLAGGISNPFWLLGVRAGYLIAFVIAAYVSARLLEKYKPRSFAKAWVILSTNEICISLIGSAWLAFFVGWNNALMMGFVPFIPGAIVKISAASAVYKFKNSF